ncbi:Universal stress protein family protein [Hymenobacter gelipurpurascens]|uniref:Universal stress protein family protein n=1 Tax=Hymenobacter gelipurpurascens TaxID=89968 RepID=A0A212TPK8_9BACT|nr:universal stress protein [Hymenobacter gelipurpurascens]SNC67850.1 Universal stress protein family protein [Hymenobacter gelipurpurascens]
MKPSFLVVTDLSARSQRATYLAALLASAVGGQLVLLHPEVLPMLEPELGMVTVPAEYFEQQRQDDAQALRELVRQLPAPAIVESLQGSLGEVLENLIVRWQPRLLVLALAAEHDVLDELLINQALPALRDTGLPLLLVPENAAQDPVMPRVVAVAADGEEFRLSTAAQALVPILAEWTTDYCIIHVATPDEESADGSRHAEATVRHSGLLPSPPRTYQVRYQPRSAGIVQAAQDVQAELLVMPVRPRTFLSSIFGCGVAAEVVRASPIPVLLLPTVPLPTDKPDPENVDGLIY